MEKEFNGHRDLPYRPIALGYFPARKMTLGYTEELWLKARDLYFNKEMSYRAISQALRINRNSVKGRAAREKWAYWRKEGKVPEGYLTPRKQIETLRLAGRETGVWRRRKLLDQRRKQVIEEAAKKIMTREDKAKEHLDRLVEKTPSLLRAMDDVVKSLEAFRDEKGNITPETIGALKDLVSTHSKLCDTLHKLETTRQEKTGGIPVESGWIGILSAVRLKDEKRVLQSQAIDLVEEVRREAPEQELLSSHPDTPLPERPLSLHVPFASAG